MLRQRKKGSSYPPHIWDQLPKIKLTQGTLREYDRRTRYDAGSIWTALLKKTEINLAATSFESDQLLPSDMAHLKHLANEGFMDVSVLRGYSGDNSAVARSSKGDRKAQACTEYGSIHGWLMIAAGVFPLHCFENIPEPPNLASIQQILTRPRPPMSISDAYMQGLARAKRFGDEEAISDFLVSLLVGDEREEGQPEPAHRAFGVILSDMPRFHPAVKVARADMVHGTAASSLPDHLRHDPSIAPFIIPSVESAHPVAPNFFVNFVEERNAFAAHRAIYCNAFGARAMLHLQNHPSSSPSPSPMTYDGNIHSISVSLYNERLWIYGTFARRCQGDRSADTAAAAGTTTSFPSPTVYYSVLLDEFVLSRNKERIIEGVNAYRNARDWAAEVRKDLLAAAIERSGDGEGRFSTEEEAQTEDIAAGLDEDLAGRMQL